ncbi:MAG: hypothetical protein HFE83_06525 [Lachnospiraceae bacterium]|jgi:uroporphyrinogen-III decarboxylase|nr:hypothetical protein [Lachnospiraceae bacterium]
MTKRERFLNVLANKPVDRVPVAFFHHFLEDWTDFGKGVENDEVFEKNIEGHRIARRLFDPDVAKIMNDSLMLMPVEASFVKTAAELRKIEPLSMSSRFVQRTLELTKRVREIYGDTDAPVYATSFSPTLVLRSSLPEGRRPGLGGPETCIKRFIKEDPEALGAACKAVSEGIIELNRLLMKEGGVDGIYLSVNNQSGFFPEEIYRTYISPSEKAVLDDANLLSEMNILHICGFIGQGNDLNLFTGFDAAAYNWAVHTEKVSLSEGKKLFGGKPVFGGFEQKGVLYKGTREEVEEYAYGILDEAGQIGIMLGADCTVPADIDDSRLEWVREAAVKYAGQPVRRMKYHAEA